MRATSWISSRQKNTGTTYLGPFTETCNSVSTWVNEKLPKNKRKIQFFHYIPQVIWSWNILSNINNYYSFCAINPFLVPKVRRTSSYFVSINIHFSLSFEVCSTFHSAIQYFTTLSKFCCNLEAYLICLQTISLCPFIRSLLLISYLSIPLLINLSNPVKKDLVQSNQFSQSIQSDFIIL